MDSIEILQVVNLILIAPIWLAIGDLKKDIRELRNTEKTLITEMLKEKIK